MDPEKYVEKELFLRFQQNVLTRLNIQSKILTELKDKLDDVGNVDLGKRVERLEELFANLSENFDSLFKSDNKNAE